MRRAKSSGHADRRVEGQHGDRLGPADRRSEAADRRAQQVHPRVARGHHRRGRHGVLALPAVARRSAEFGHPGPQPAGRPQLGDRGELVGGHGEAELERVQRVGDRQPGVGQRAQVGHADRRGDGQLVGVAGAGVVIDRGVDGRDPQLGRRGDQRGEAARTSGRRGCRYGRARPIGSAPSEPASALAITRRPSSTRRGGLDRLVPASRTIGASSRYTPSSAARGRRRRAAVPDASHSDVTPLARSRRTAALCAPGPGRRAARGRPSRRAPRAAHRG